MVFVVLVYWIVQAEAMNYWRWLECNAIKCYKLKKIISIAHGKRCTWIQLFPVTSICKASLLACLVVRLYATERLSWHCMLMLAGKFGLPRGRRESRFPRSPSLLMHTSEFLRTRMNLTEVKRNKVVWLKRGTTIVRTRPKTRFSVTSTMVIPF